MVATVKMKAIIEKSNLVKNVFFWIIAGTLIFTLLDGYSRGSVKEELTYSEFKKEVQANGTCIYIM